MPAGTYLVGVCWTAIVVAAVVLAGSRLRDVLAPGLTGVSAHLGTAVIALALALSIGHLLGSVGQLQRWWVLVLSVVVAVVILLTAGRSRGRRPKAPTSPPPSSSPGVGGREESVIAAGCLAAVAWQWSTHLADSYDRGMLQPDNLWYHGPFMAHFLQTEGFGDLGTLGYREARYYPLDSELLHALMTAPFGRDVLVPITNHLFAAMGLVAAFVIGRRFGVGALAVLAGTVVLSLPLVSATQPGQMYNDVAAASLVLAAIALLIDSGLVPGSLVIAGSALGMAASTKFTVAALVATLWLGVIVAAVMTRRWRALLAWVAASVATGAFWFARNWVVHGNPLPYVDLNVGPVELSPSVSVESGQSLLSTLDDLDRHGAYYLDSLDVSFGRLWLILLAACFVGVVYTVLTAPRWAALAAGASLAGLLTWPLLPHTGDLPFVHNLRYLVPALTLGLVMTVVAVAAHRRIRVLLTIALVVCVITNLLSPHLGPVAAWPGHHWAGGVAAVSTLAVLAQARWLVPSPASLTRRVRWSMLAVPTVLALVAGGWFVQRHYLDRRYADSGVAAEALYEPFAALSGVKVDVIGFVETYPMFGTDLTNDVQVWTEELTLDVPLPADSCRFWRRALAPGPRYVAVSTGWMLRVITPAQRAEWFEDDPAVTVVVSDPPHSVYAIDGDLDPTAC